MTDQEWQQLQREQEEDLAQERWELTEAEMEAMAETYRAEWLLAEEEEG